MRGQRCKAFRIGAPHGLTLDKESTRSLGPLAIIVEGVDKVKMAPEEGQDVLVPLSAQSAQGAERCEIAELDNAILYFARQGWNASQGFKFPSIADMGAAVGLPAAKYMYTTTSGR